MRDPYIDEITENQGKLFETACDNGDDMADFALKYMKSKIRSRIDERCAIECNLFYDDIYYLFNRETSVRRAQHRLDPVICNWVGEFYSLFENRTRLKSRSIIDKLGFNKLYRMALTLHDIDIELAVDNVVSTMGLRKEAAWE